MIAGRPLALCVRVCVCGGGMRRSLSLAHLRSDPRPLHPYVVQVAEVEAKCNSQDTMDTCLLTQVFGPSAPSNVAALPGNGNVSLTWELPK